MPDSVERVHLTVNGVTYALSPLEDVGDLRSRVLRAIDAGSGFLDVTVDDGQHLVFYVTASTNITIAVSRAVPKPVTADEDLQVRSGDVEVNGDDIDPEPVR